MSKQRWEDLRQAASAYPTEALKADAIRCLSYLIQTSTWTPSKSTYFSARTGTPMMRRIGDISAVFSFDEAHSDSDFAAGPSVSGYSVAAAGAGFAYGLRPFEEGGPDDARHGTSCKTRVHGWRHSHSPRLSIDHRQEEQGGVEGRRGAATDGGTPSEVEAAATQRAAPLGLRRGQLRKAWSAGWRTARLIYRQIQTNEASVHGLHARSVCRNAQGSEAGNMARVDAAKRRVPSGRAATAGRDLQSCSPRDAYMLRRARALSPRAQKSEEAGLRTPAAPSHADSNRLRARVAIGNV